jgi:hypothetical protein
MNTVSVLYIRHGQTEFNIERKRIYKSSKSEKDYHADLCFMEDFKFTDSDLSEEGVIYTLRVREKKSALLSNVKYIVTSPLHRAMHTAQILFEDQLNNELTVAIVHPDIRTLAKNLYDLPYKIAIFPKGYERFDMSLLAKDINQHGIGWFVNSLIDRSLAEEILTEIKENDSKNHKEQIEVILRVIRRIHPEFLEEENAKMQKLLQFKEWLKNFIIDKKVRDGELAIIAHDSVLTPIVESDYYINGNIPISKSFKNSEIYVHKFVTDAVYHK